MTNIANESFATRVNNVEQILIEYASQRQCITYKELAEEYNNRGFETDIVLLPSRFAKPSEEYLNRRKVLKIGHLVGATNRYYYGEYRNKRPILLSSIVINSKGMPQGGFDGFVIIWKRKKFCKWEEVTKEEHKWLTEKKKDPKIWKVLIEKIQEETFNAFDPLVTNINNIEALYSKNNPDFIATKKALKIEIEVRKPIKQWIKDAVRTRVKKARGAIECEGVLCKNRQSFKSANDGMPYLEFHHIQEIGMDGLHEPSNLQLLCPNCHREKHFGKNYE